MYKKIFLSVAGLAAAAAVPYAIVAGPRALSGVRQIVADATSPVPAAELSPATSPAPPLLDLPAPPRTNSYAVVSLAEVFRFDATPDWIMRRWPRVSTGLADLQLQGYRVPLVTGTAETDLAGSLTYYFNAQQRVQRITFTGATGNISQLAGMLTTRFRMARRLTNDPSLIVFEGASASGQPVSSVQIHTAPLIQSGNVYQRYNVQLVLERPEA